MALAHFITSIFISAGRIVASGGSCRRSIIPYQMDMWAFSTTAKSTDHLLPHITQDEAVDFKLSLPLILNLT